MCKNTVEVYDQDRDEWWVDARFACQGDAWAWGDRLRGRGLRVRVTQVYGKYRKQTELQPLESEVA